MFKKRLFLVEILILFSVFISLVNSFTIAGSDHIAEIKITSSADALISIPVDISIKISKSFQESQVDGLESLAPGSENSLTAGTQIIENNFKITNNLVETIQVHLDSDYEHISFNDLTIFSGDTAAIDVLIDDSTETGIADIVITAVWDDGYAEIEAKLHIDVV